MDIRLDFRDLKQAEKFPRHGWAENSRGQKLLWFPIMNVLVNTSDIRAAKAAKPATDQIWSAGHFIETLRKLATTLRELETLRTAARDYLYKEPEDWSESELRQSQRSSDLAIIFVEAAYGYLRRSADHFGSAVRAVLFEDYKTAPSNFLKLRKFILDQRTVSRPGCLIDVESLVRVFREHTGWFDQIRNPSGGDLGLRDAMEHGQYSLKVGRALGGSDGPSLMGHLVNFSRVDSLESGKPLEPNIHQEVELVQTLQTILSQLSDFYTEVCKAVGCRSGYSLNQKGDYLYIRGSDNDVVRFWPQI